MFLYALTNLNHNSVCIQKLQPSCQQIKGMLSHCLTRTPTHRHIHRCILSLCLRSSGTQLFHSSYTTAVSLVPHPPMCPLVSPGSDHQQLLSLSMICWCWGLFFNPSPFFSTTTVQPYTPVSNQQDIEEGLYSLNTSVQKDLCHCQRL